MKTRAQDLIKSYRALTPDWATAPSWANYRCAHMQGRQSGWYWLSLPPVHFQPAMFKGSAIKLGADTRPDSKRRLAVAIPEELVRNDIDVIEETLDNRFRQELRT